MAEMGKHDFSLEKGWDWNNCNFCWETLVDRCRQWHFTPVCSLVRKTKY